MNNETSTMIVILPSPPPLSICTHTLASQNFARAFAAVAFVNWSLCPSIVPPPSTLHFISNAKMIRVVVARNAEAYQYKRRTSHYPPNR